MICSKNQFLPSRDSLLAKHNFNKLKANNVKISSSLKFLLSTQYQFTMTIKQHENFVILVCKVVNEEKIKSSIFLL